MSLKVSADVPSEINLRRVATGGESFYSIEVGSFYVVKARREPDSQAEKLLKNLTTRSRRLRPAPLRRRARSPTAATGGPSGSMP